MKILKQENVKDTVLLEVALTEKGNLRLQATISADKVLDAVAERIPGKVDDALLQAAKNYLVRLGGNAQ